MQKDRENWLRRAVRAVKRGFHRAFRWCKRAVLGGRSELQTQTGKIESPSRLVREAFFRKKTAVVALVLLVGLFLFVFLAPSFVPFDVNYTDPLQQNVAPSYSLRSVPKKLKKQIAYIDGFADSTVGVSTGGKLYVWGNTKNRLNGANFKNFPQEIRSDGVAFASAGKDHIIALTTTGKLVGWGDKSCGQYGVEPVLNALPMPEKLTGYIEPSSVKQLLCGYQASALVFQTGEVCVWGNTNAVRNLSEFSGRKDVAKMAFTNAAAVALLKDGSITTGAEDLFTAAVSSRLGRTTLRAALQGERVTELVATGKCIAATTERGTLIVAGAFENGEDELPVLANGEVFTALDGGTRHFVGVTNFGNVYAWGHNAYGQCNAAKQGARVYAGSLQTYVVDETGKLTDSAGLKGYLMGTDGRGRDVFARITHGGKTTMTIGAVAVLVSSLIAIVVGCISGYFGGWIDTLLMRITEIFSSIPFLPFAMLLSQIIKHYNVSETTRIFIIMLILGALSWTGLARMIRGQVLAEREKEFVTAARAIGVKERKIAFRHVLPNVVSVIFVSMTLDFAGCLLTESSLSYLGFGVQQPRPTWGNMLNGCNNSTIIQRYWWQWLFPALFLSLAVICINVIGDAMRDALDPKSDRA
ncbi:MAG: ABC transporter permease subunit [Clostridia bacterium]|nr:ABC transporter permease subunit [Clostridia bacterium]